VTACVISEEQVPGFLVLIHSSRLQRRRDVEHHDVVLMMRKNTGKIMLADCVRPCVDNRLDLTFGRSASLHHGSRSNRLLMYVPEDERRGADPTRRIIFHAGAPGDHATAASGRSRHLDQRVLLGDTASPEHLSTSAW